MTSLTDPITTSNITHRVPAQPPKVEDSSTALTSDFETYLKMLTVQMENQDPLDPADASEFSVQLATFSSLEQQVYGNQLLEQMIASAGQSGGVDMVSLLGREALVDENATFTGTPIAVRIPDLPDHDTAVLRVENDFGGSFATQPLDKNARSIQWPPSADLGTTPHASYRFVIETTDEAGVVTSTPALVPHQVTEVMRRGDSFDVVLANGSVHSAADVTGFAQ